MIWFTVYGAFTPTPSTFDDEAKAIAYAESAINSWATEVSVVKSETVWKGKYEPERI